MTQRLIVFTRYPEPHRTKTRLIPALGPEGAANVQREMTRHLLTLACRLAHRSDVDLEVRFEGGDETRMAAAFGNGIAYRHQSSGDLGCRMHRAFADAAGDGCHQTALIGSDCPEITESLLDEAFERLSEHDVVLGPTHDGGYYLIGLRQPTAALFEDMPWGTDRVFETTLQRAADLSLKVACLKELSDIDRPEDLVVWNRVKRAETHRSDPDRISIIIPTLNEEGYLPRTLSDLCASETLEIIVADGGSTDRTCAVALEHGCHVIATHAGRAIQLNAGAEWATGSILLFLHADTHLPKGFESDVRTTLNGRGVVAGAFDLHIDGAGRALRLIERGVHLRSRWLYRPYGDQALFLRRSVFEELGGFPPLPIMEDFEFVRRLRRRGRIAIVPRSVSTSDRRWRRLGPWRTTWINQKVILGYYLGISTERLATWY